MKEGVKDRKRKDPRVKREGQRQQGSWLLRVVRGKAQPSKGVLVQRRTFARPPRVESRNRERKTEGLGPKIVLWCKKLEK